MLKAAFILLALVCYSGPFAKQPQKVFIWIGWASGEGSVAGRDRCVSKFSTDCDSASPTMPEVVVADGISHSRFLKIAVGEL